MKVGDRYIIFSVLRTFGVVLAAVSAVYLAVDFFEKIDDFMEAGLGAAVAAFYFAAKLPFILSQIAPVGMLISVFVIFGIMNRNNEITALRSGGVGPVRLVMPVALMGLVTSLLLFCFNETVVPETSFMANKIWYQQVRKERVMVSKDKDIWFRTKDAIVYMAFFDPETGMAYKVSINYFDGDFNIRRRIDAARAAWKSQKMILHDGMDQLIDSQHGILKTEFFDKLTVNTGFVPDDFKRVVKRVEEMSIKELASYINSLEAEGYDPTRYRVDFNGKIALPFACLVMSLVGAGLGMRPSAREGLPIGITYGIGIAFVYWVVYSFLMSMGYGALFPGILSAWTANILFLFFGIFLVAGVE